MNKTYFTPQIHIALKIIKIILVITNTTTVQSYHNKIPIIFKVQIHLYNF